MNDDYSREAQGGRSQTTYQPNNWLPPLDESMINKGFDQSGYSTQMDISSSGSLPPFTFNITETDNSEPSSPIARLPLSRSNDKFETLYGKSADPIQTLKQDLANLKQKASRPTFTKSAPAFIPHFSSSASPMSTSSYPSLAASPMQTTAPQSPIITSSPASPPNLPHNNGTYSINIPSHLQQHQQPQQQQPIMQPPAFGTLLRQGRHRNPLNMSVDALKLPKISALQETTPTPSDQSTSFISALSSKLNSTLGQAESNTDTTQDGLNIKQISLSPSTTPPLATPNNNQTPGLNIQQNQLLLAQMQQKMQKRDPNQRLASSMVEFKTPSVVDLTDETKSQAQNQATQQQVRKPLGKYIGRFSTEIVGSRLTFGVVEVTPKEEMRLSLHISHDKFLIQVHSAITQVTLGMLPDTVSWWLAPLIEKRWIRVRASLPVVLTKVADYGLVIDVLVPNLVLQDYVNLDNPLQKQLWESLAQAINVDVNEMLNRTSVNALSKIADIPVVDLTEDKESARKRISASADSVQLLKKQRVEEGRPIELKIEKLEPPVEQYVDKLFLGLRPRVMKEMEGPDLLNVTLRPYQKQALGWMFDREKSQEERNLEKAQRGSEPVKLPDCPWVEHISSEGRKYYHNIDTGQTTWDPPVQFILREKADVDVRGGILADEMGMGKTIMILSLILTSLQPKWENITTQVPLVTNDNSPSDTQEFMSSPDESSVSSQSMETSETQSDTDYAEVKVKLETLSSRATLIVCPLSVLNQWSQEIRARTNSNANLSLYCYHGTNRARDPLFLAAHDIVLTTYATLSGEIPPDSNKNLKRPPKQETPSLLLVPWFRVVLDEAHTIKDRNTRTAKAAFALRSERKWCVTGTPIQNKLDDLYSLFHFLGVEPYCEYAWWSKLILRPIKNRDEKGFARLQGVLETILLRRTKDQKIENGQPIVSLPPRTIVLKTIELNGEEADIYQKLWAMSKMQFKDFVESGTVMENYAHILELLLRLRQACDHPDLIKSKAKNTNEGKSNLQDVAKLLAEAPNEALPRLKEVLGSSDLSEAQCAICLESMDAPHITICGHLFCKSCIQNHLETTEQGCPICRTQLQMNQILPVPKIKDKDKQDEKKEWRSSPKINALMEELHSLDHSVKSIIFSQWTSMLNLVEIPLKRAGIKFVRLDGTMNHYQREKSITAFKEDPEVRVFLISMKAGGLGLNLIVATHVYLLDPWWNPATEEQAIDRAHRLGQTKPVHVVRFVIKDSIEERILELQARKKTLAQGALGTMTTKELRQIRIEELRLLFRD